MLKKALFMKTLVWMCKHFIKSWGSDPRGCLSITRRFLPNCPAPHTQPLDQAAGWCALPGHAFTNSENFLWRHSYTRAPGWEPDSAPHASRWALLGRTRHLRNVLACNANLSLATRKHQPQKEKCSIFKEGEGLSSFKMSMSWKSKKERRGWGGECWSWKEAKETWQINVTPEPTLRARGRGCCRGC